MAGGHGLTGSGARVRLGLSPVLALVLVSGGRGLTGSGARVRLGLSPVLALVLVSGWWPAGAV
ncbi:hypothetical protein [Streptomyces sp. B21-083]|uniref:hypothetical protein n=1 Tax=Streptomyces sp. B21-083 TaxID=3039410 RepID=UPI002FF3D4AA